MGRLHNPGLGEKLDRITILELKANYAADPTPFLDEHKAIEDTLPILLVPLLDILEHLRRVNLQLWDAEDALRRLRAREAALTVTEAREALRVGFQIQELNDTRASIIAQLNEAGGTPWVEKSPRKKG